MKLQEIHTVKSTDKLSNAIEKILVNTHRTVFVIKEKKFVDVVKIEKRTRYVDIPIVKEVEVVIPHRIEKIVDERQTKNGKELEVVFFGSKKSLWIQEDNCYFPNGQYISFVESIFKGDVFYVDFAKNSKISILTI